ncbi:ARM repeat-containing protein [Wolfiporia cocos MD-104 SS10]|uniref:ARM repeat-containing protein n=1 Tax=Wolfiporia cocos (strain MD-104) TaxID=742152 RepID=A0A2H3JYK9_WOLCO|nr:ARM repeat-containing protein [Wolfiporia cocos MD-104 SS10]
MAPGRTQPQPQTFSPDELYNVICAAASQDPAQVQASANRLKEIIQIPGVFDTLHEIAAQKTLPLPVRQQSIIQFKNAALGHWKSRKFSPEDYKARIRTRCLSLLDEGDDVISECNEVIIAKIARSDYPQAWPELLPQLLSIINTGIDMHYATPTPDSGLALRRSLQVLNAVIKELVSVKLPSGLKNTGILAEQIHMVLQTHYSHITASFSSSITPDTISLSRTAEDLLLAHLVFKCIVKIAEWTWNRNVSNNFEHLAPWVHQLFQASVGQLQSLSELRINLVLALQQQLATLDAVGQRTLDMLTRHVRLFGKFFRRVQHLSVTKFVKLPLCSELVLYYWNKVVQASEMPAEAIADTSTAVFPVRFLVQAMTLFKDSLTQWAPVRRDGTENTLVLSKDFVENAVRLLVTRFIPLNPADLEEWMADPEGWVNVEEQDNEQWVFEIRPCAERVLITLANNYQTFVIPLLETTFKQLVSQHPTDLAGVIQREALYCAVGRCASKMKDVIPFGQWLEHTLIAEAQETSPSYPILKRRIAWIVGKWISDMSYPANDARIWQVLLYLLQDRGPGSDEVVRLTAALAVKDCVDSLQFDADVFAPYMPGVVNELVRLMAEAETLESKRRIALSLNTVIEQSGTRIVPLVQSIAEPIPQLWTAAGTDWLFKSSLLETVTVLVQSSKEHSVSLASLVVPLVQDGLSPGASVQLDQDALNLWLGALRNTVTVEGLNGGPGLIDLFPLVVSLLSENLDLLGQITHIVESYYLLDPARVLQLHATDLLRAYGQAVRQALGINVQNLATSLALLFQVAPPQLWGGPLHDSGLFAWLVQTLVDDKATTFILTECVYVLARIAIADNRMFLQLMSATAMAQNTQEKVLYEGVLDQWWTRFDNMSEPRLRKLTAMGIANLIATGRPEVMERLSSEVCNMWLDVFSEMKEAQTADESGGLSLKLYWEQPTDSFYQGTEGTLEYNRRKALFEDDPVRTTQLTEYIAARLQEAEVAVGGPANLQSLYLAKADPLVIKQIQDELTTKRI